MQASLHHGHRHHIIFNIILISEKGIKFGKVVEKVSMNVNSHSI